MVLHYLHGIQLGAQDGLNCLTVGIFAGGATVVLPAVTDSADRPIHEYQKQK